jgi:hypothetical protein
VAIPLRENVPILFPTPLAFGPRNRLEIALDPAALKPHEMDFK